MKFAKKPASRILVNTGGSQGGTGASTGLAPAFTLGCGTWGGSSVSENVTPLHLINIKRVAYGLKDCTTLAADDTTFNYCATNPAEFAAKSNCASTAADTTDNDKLARLVSELVAAMKGAN
ncbi:Aldehyde-alcohol dehydrogenase [Clostridium coskatii]|uniref:Aldehyde-alcohol dehydrogenase n=1 Tax=Clostridium coskatii TaxID=1705578 RepID=A0A168L4J1_9CLOT|nr:Aldehyde-alcohol dehydrogenase [Clostridium coskatii]